MNIKWMFTAFTVKALLTTTCVTIAFASFTSCYAQSIIGKWKGVSAKYYYSAEYAKQSGKAVEEKAAKDVGDSWGEYKADHTLTLSFSAPNSKEVTIMNGTWSVSGNQLKVILEPQYNPQNTTTVATFTISGNTMVTTSVIVPATRLTRVISTSTKM